MSKSDDAAVRHWHAEVSKAAEAYERRWTMLALRRVDPDLAKRLDEQRALFNQACITGTPDEVERHGAAMCRGWAACVRTLEAAGEPDDAYVLGQCPRTGFRIAIGHARAAAGRVDEQFAGGAVWVSPDEVAALLAGLEGFKALSVMKRCWPGCEVIDVRPGDPAKADSSVE